MPLFPVIDIESLVQENDKTRVDVSKSYAAGVPDISLIEVTPSLSVADPIDVTELGYLDWQFEFKIDVTSANNKVDFVEAGAPLVATLDAGEYSLSELATEIATQMTTSGALTYTGAASGDVVTISASGNFSILGVTGANVGGASVLASIGFIEDTALAASATGEQVKQITKTISVRVANETEERTITREIQVISELADKLFSSDDRLRKHESDVMKYLPEGRATFKDVHRRAQTLILAWLDTQGFIDNLGDKITVDAFVDTEEVAEWSTMMTMRLIFESVHNAKDDVFEAKAKKYTELENFYRNRATIKMDLDQDGVADAVAERLDTRSCVVVRR